MTITLSRLRTFAAASLIACAFLTPRAAHAQLTFDDVSTNAAGYNNNFTSYNGFTFFGFDVATTASLGSGTNTVSGTKFALGQDSLSAIGGFNQPAFNLFSAWLSYRQFDTVNPDNGPIGISIEAYRPGVVAPAYVQLITLTNTAQLFTFNFLNVEEVAFQTAPLIQGGRSSALAVDNVQLAVVPEPSTLLLLAVGATAMLVVVRRKRRT